MTLVAATYTVALRYTRIAEKELYFATTAVCITEVIKLFLSVGILAKETGSLGRLMTSLRENVLGSPKELLKLSVPSVVYAVQNNMAFLALSNLDAAVYQVTYQLKIPCTALCTVLMLNRSLSKLQWFSVFMLCGGVTLVQWKPAQVTKVQVSIKEFRYFPVGEEHSDVLVWDCGDFSWCLHVRRSSSSRERIFLWLHILCRVCHL
uniref:Solute carrier family 35 member A1 n=1 Tax=Chelonoidis abingdonii TaxID=106734 RepID=A0A8C0IK62_CHEAB